MTRSWLVLAALAALGGIHCGDDAPSSTTGAGGIGGSSVGGTGLESTGGDNTGGEGAQPAGGSGGEAGSGGAGGAPPWTGVPVDTPQRILFIGNSFTHQGPIPDMVRALAASVGWPTPDTQYSAPGGVSLAFHAGHEPTLDLVDEGDWDFVVVQDFSTRPTDNAGDPQAFKADATWFYDRIKAASPDARIVLYETWARHPDHGIYPGTFTDPAEMQAQLRFHYNDAADSYIPANATFVPPDDLHVAPVGDAWETYLAQPNAVVLHGSDDYHAGANGQYLNAAVLYSSIYGVVATGASSLGVGEAAAALQSVADQTTGITTQPPAIPQPDLAIGTTIRIDLGANATAAAGWNSLTDCTGGALADLVDARGAATAVDALVVDAFIGANAAGIADNALGFPGDVSSDVCWTGSFDGHAAALDQPAALQLQDVDEGRYEVTLFASRSGDDGGLGRLTRFTVGSRFVDLEVSDNVASTASFDDVIPNQAGNIDIGVAVSPAGLGRFAYLGAIELTKTSD